VKKVCTLKKLLKETEEFTIKIFKQITGVTPIIYLRDFRIEQSIKCLSKGYTVTQTAYMCGFNNLSYFIRAFRERFNMPPKEFQKTVL
jgi:AraC-like DNA-binding protein